MTIESTGAGQRQTANAGSHAAERRRNLSIFVLIFIFGLVTPLFFYLGPVRLSVHRIVLLLLFFPSLYFLFTGRVGRIRLADILVTMICVWSSISLIVLHGISTTVEPIGILWVETLGAYLVGRCFIRTPEALYSMIRLLFWLCVLVAPFAVYEAITSRNLVIEFFQKLGPAATDHPEIGDRMGLDRVQGPLPPSDHVRCLFRVPSFDEFLCAGISQQQGSARHPDCGDNVHGRSLPFDGPVHRDGHTDRHIYLGPSSSRLQVPVVRSSRACNPWLCRCRSAVEPNAVSCSGDLHVLQHRFGICSDTHLAVRNREYLGTPDIRDRD